MNKPVRIAAPEQTDFRARFTAAEFEHMCATGAFDGMKVELIDGELQRMNPPMNTHGRYQAQIAFRLMSVAGEALIRVETGVVLTEDSLVGCDAIMLTRSVVENRMLRPDDVALAIEIAVTTFSKDMGVKRSAYARGGVANYWVIDPERAVVHCFAAPVAGEYTEMSSFKFGQPMAVPGTGRTITLD